jgi:outer membrane protein OmpA-like peptidoglycan-associated protein
LKGIITILILLICTTTFGQDSTKTFKTFESEQFEVNDIILAPKIYFTFSGGPRVVHNHIDSIKVIADFLIANPTIVVEIGVHTDFRGNAESNLKLSERRAMSVKSVLEHQFNIPAERLEIAGYGESDPLIIEKEILETPEEQREDLHAINRRVEIRILKN